ncbi:MAG TPA: hypothetical protein VG733_19185 [Chthoniobacteraceae bacterium]|nr:hypothetical protein [Chthoniobacteraceae bacterium]
MILRTLVAVALSLPFCCRAFEISYWVWERTAPLSQSEIAELHAQGVTTIYWNVGEISNTGADWKWKAAPEMPKQVVDGLAIVPVVRITSIGKTPFEGASIEAFVAKLRVAAIDSGLQVDFDCPDRLLGSYANALKALHAAVPKLTVTALAGWSNRPGWEALQQSVDAIFPMFYDLGPDTSPAQGGPEPLAGVQATSERISSWSACKIPWMAGLPSFGRLSLFGADGHWLGNIRQWGWDDVCFNQCLTSEKTIPGGVTLFRVKAGGIVSSTPVKKDQVVAARLPARDTLSAAIFAAQKAGARGVVWFRLPDSGDPSGWSLKQMGSLDPRSASPKLVLRATAAGRLSLVNDSSTDLEPRLSGTNGMDRGYALELDADAPIFREATAGDFWKVTGHANPDTKPALLAIPLSTRLTFWFSHLRAGESLDCGLIQLAPNTTFKQIRYRVLQFGEKWQSIE